MMFTRTDDMWYCCKAQCADLTILYPT